MTSNRGSAALPVLLLHGSNVVATTRMVRHLLVLGPTEVDVVGILTAVINKVITGLLLVLLHGNKLLLLPRKATQTTDIPRQAMLIRTMALPLAMLHLLLALVPSSRLTVVLAVRLHRPLLVMHHLLQ